MLPPDFTKFDQNASQRLEVSGGFAAEGLEQLFMLNFLHHLQAILYGQGCHAEDDVLKDFGHNATESEHDTGPEMGIANQPADQLPFTFHHLLNEHRFAAGYT